MQVRPEEHCFTRTQRRVQPFSLLRRHNENQGTQDHSTDLLLRQDRLHRRQEREPSETCCKKVRKNRAEARVSGAVQGLQDSEHCWFMRRKVPHQTRTFERVSRHVFDV